MKKISLRAITAEAKLLLIGIPVFLWTIIPVYHMFLFAISERDSATSGRSPTASAPSSTGWTCSTRAWSPAS